MMDRRTHSPVLAEDDEGGIERTGVFKTKVEGRGGRYVLGFVIASHQARIHCSGYYTTSAGRGGEGERGREMDFFSTANLSRICPDTQSHFETRYRLKRGKLALAAMIDSAECFFLYKTCWMSIRGGADGPHCWSCCVRGGGVLRGFLPRLPHQGMTILRSNHLAARQALQLLIIIVLAWLFSVSSGKRNAFRNMQDVFKRIRREWSQLSPCDIYTSPFYRKRPINYLPS